LITLGIETSCDETACAVLENSNILRSNIVSSSLAKHKPFGGVVPEIASRHTLENIDIIFKEALRKGKVDSNNIDLISVTYGPGLIGSLLVGVSFAKALSMTLSVPFVGVNHLHAHIFANFINKRVPHRPYIGLVVSGGHTSIVLCTRNNFKELASTRDDACGEAFDKVAKILGLGYPGGPIIEEVAKSGNPDKIRFKCGRFKNSFDFSFSGIKTAVLYYVKKCKNVRKEIPDICASFQKSVINDLVNKTIALAIANKAKIIAAGGGVTANNLLRMELAKEAEKYNITVLFPPVDHSLDNGAMVARYGYELFRRGKSSDFGLSSVPRLGF